jgi:hypothetical protein
VKRGEMWEDCQSMIPVIRCGLSSWLQLGYVWPISPQKKLLWINHHLSTTCLHLPSP